MQWDDRRVRILHPRTGQREHLRQPRGLHRIRRDDQPKRTSPGILRLLGQAHTMGAHIGAGYDAIHARDGFAAVRRIQGVLSFSKKYEAARLDATCANAVEFDLCTYRLVRRHLEHQAEPTVTLWQIDPIIRQLNLVQAIGQAAIAQSYRVLYRETHVHGHARDRSAADHRRFRHA